MSFLTPLFLLGLAALAVPVLDSPDAARTQVGRRVSVADVPAQDSVRVGAAAPHSRLAAAGASARGVGADRHRLRAPVLAWHESRRRLAAELVTQERRAKAVTISAIAARRSASNSRSRPISCTDRRNLRRNQQGQPTPPRGGREQDRPAQPSPAGQKDTATSPRRNRRNRTTRNERQRVRRGDILDTTPSWLARCVRLHHTSNRTGIGVSPSHSVRARSGAGAPIATRSLRALAAIARSSPPHARPACTNLAPEGGEMPRGTAREAGRSARSARRSASNSSRECATLHRHW